jgi:hypothetical protein
VLRNGKVDQVAVETGLSSSTQTEIVSGLSENDTVITSVITTGGTSQQRTTQGQSPFGGGGFGGNALRIGR